MKFATTFLITLFFCTVMISGNASAQTEEEKTAKECKNLAVSINSLSRTALNKMTDEKEAAQEAVSKIFTDCDKFVNEFKCTKTTWPWLGTNISLSKYCYDAILTYRRHRQKAEEELLEKSKSLQPSKPNATSGRDEKVGSAGAIR